MTTFKDLMDRYGEDVAYLAADLIGTPQPSTGLTPERFAEQVQDAVDVLRHHPRLVLHYEADQLQETASLLRTAIEIDDDHRSAVLDIAAKYLTAITKVAADIRLAS
ncbi:hypothetical protein ACWGB8_01880 [Kitasatospora sp. NPDC054939]